MKNRPKYLENMNCDAVDINPRTVDYSEGHMETWEFLDAVECETCGKVMVAIGGENHHNDLDSESDCGGYCGCSDGPIMNYFYEVPGLEFSEENAIKLNGLPLCLVKINDEIGMALTGGGMDLSWQICQGYMELGYLPPIHFRLPKMADGPLSAHQKKTVKCCMESLRVAKLRLNYAISDLKSTVNWYKDRAKA